MGRLLSCVVAALALKYLHGIGAFAQADQVYEDIAGEDTKASPPAVSVSATFPDAEVFGIKLINGKPTQALLSLSNDEAEPITVKFVGGVLWSLASEAQESRILRNLTAAKYNVNVPAGEKQSLPYKVVTELHPQDLRLELATIISGSDGTEFAVPSFNGTVSIVEPDTSIFDPRVIFLYIFMLSCVGGVLYVFYTIWIAPYFPQKRSRGGGDRAKKSTIGASKKADPAAADTADGPAVATGAKSYNEEWIPAHHIQRPEARRVKTAPRPKSRGKAE